MAPVKLALAVVCFSLDSSGRGIRSNRFLFWYPSPRFVALRNLFSHFWHALDSFLLIFVQTFLKHFDLVFEIDGFALGQGLGFGGF